MWLILLAAIAIEPPYREHRCDVIEVNHVHNGKAERTFTQVICWSWIEGRMNVDFWVVTWANGQPTSSTLRFNGDTWDLQHRGQWYRIRAGEHRERWLQFDAEVADREWCPMDLRRGLPLSTRELKEQLHE